MLQKQSNELIAVICCDGMRAWRWLLEEYSSINLGVKESNRQARTITFNNGNTYILIDNISQAHGYEFVDYIKSPDFYSLEDVVKSRIR
jgi:hypothetical protein